MGGGPEGLILQLPTTE